MEEIAFAGVFIGVAIGWLLVAVLLKRLRTRHASVFFSQLGAPKIVQLGYSKFSESRWQLQWRFMQFMWRGEFLKLHDPVLSSVGLVGLLTSIITVGLLVLIISGALK